jgi:hypothetical protein
MVKMVVMKFTPPMMVPKPLRASPKTHRSPPMPGEKVVLDNGAYANHPNDAAPWGVKKPETATRLPKKENQNAMALSRGKATSGAPI